MTGDGTRRRGDDRGSATAELAVALPAVVLVLLLGLGAVGAGMRQVALQDAVADSARLLGRGESQGTADAAISRVDAGASISARRADGLVCVTVEADAAFAGRIAIPLRAVGCALDGGR
ncbi:Flp pilus assembly protein TadG [Microbacterium resistens]|uniref:Flp pilus assembly protein TadG n=1 Tax=Microbacterium resistens TaxID=156977 RepID=A0ABU1SFJ1_9MICO|nr:TadE family type IV pilus minor pilin [Microbacterium resistens]MDR6867637.1 Flp pilus assembly protein TadG [Microbacterium resistens]